jgi:hypothetical protein
LAAWLQITLELAAGASSKLPYPNVFGNGPPAVFSGPTAKFFSPSFPVVLLDSPD